MDHYLMGEDNNTPNLPKIISETANYDGALEYLSAPSDFKTRNYELTAQETAKTSPDDYQWKLLPQKPVVNKFSTAASFLSSGINAESHANHHYTNNHDWFWFQTPQLKRDTRIFGEIKIKVRVSSPDREWITMTPGIVDVDPACHQFIAGQHNTDPACLPRSVQSTTRGFLDSRYRNGLAKQSLVAPGKPIDMTVKAKPIDYVFKKGHYIGLNIQTEIDDWALPKPYPCPPPSDAPEVNPGNPTNPADMNKEQGCLRVRVHWEEGATSLILPIVGGPSSPLDLFDFGPHGDH
jgi:predicted acyl esterase